MIRCKAVADGPTPDHRFYKIAEIRVVTTDDRLAMKLLGSLATHRNFTPEKPLQITFFRILKA
jgi:hypothetical protein